VDAGAGLGSTPIASCIVYAHHEFVSHFLRALDFMNKPPPLSHFTPPNYWEFSYEKLMISGGRNAVSNWRGVHAKVEYVFS